MTAQPGGDATVLGGNERCVSPVAGDPIDAVQVLVHPVVLGSGTSLLAGLASPVARSRAGLRAFDDGSTLLTDEPAGRRAGGNRRKPQQA